jgi:hypothetical protein
MKSPSAVVSCVFKALHPAPLCLAKRSPIRLDSRRGAVAKHRDHDIALQLRTWPFIFGLQNGLARDVIAVPDCCS